MSSSSSAAGAAAAAAAASATGSLSKQQMEAQQAAIVRKLPFLPGYNIDIPNKKNFHKTHIFEVKQGTRTHKEHGLADHPYARSAGMTSTLEFSSLPEDYKEDSKRAHGHNFQPTAGKLPMGTLPPWVAYDRKVLRFFGFFKESVHSSQVENFRVRRCIVYYYLEDGSLHIAEPKVENSGIPQGVFVKRHKVPLSDTTVRGATIGLNELFIGAELKIYGRVFRLVDADEYTRAFYAEADRPLGAKEEYPVDPFAAKQRAKPKFFNKMMHPMKLFLEASKGKHTVDTAGTQKFLKNDGKVLRFYCQWHDDNVYGEKRPYILHYYLADDNVEIVEIQQPNSGRDPFPALLKKQRLPKNATSNHPDVSRIGMQGKDEKMSYYTDRDLKVGGTIKVFTRALLLSGCDNFTREYYVTKYGANPDDYKELEVAEEVDEVPKMLPPPHNGIGTEEDSLGSFLYLMPKVPKHDFKKLMENDGINLRYLAKFLDPQVEDKDRRFIITYYLNNDTVSVFEKFERNSGFIGGKFFERARAKNPQTGEYFKPTDFFVGGRISFNKYAFEIIEGDEYTLNYMRECFGVDAQGKPIPGSLAQEKAAEQEQRRVQLQAGGSTQTMQISGGSPPQARSSAAAAPSAAAAAAAARAASPKSLFVTAGTSALAKARTPNRPAK